MGSHSVELDVRRCGTGELIVHHNPVLDDGTPLNSTSLGDLPGHIPTLDDALDACAGMWVNVEIKNDPTEPDFDPSESITRDTVELLRRRGAPDQWLVSSFRRETIDETVRLWPELPTAYLVVDVTDADSLAKDLVASGNEESKLLSNDRENEVVVRFGQIEDLRPRCPKPRAKKPSSVESDEGLHDLESHGTRASQPGP